MDDGGPAFPRPRSEGNLEVYDAQQGLSLRDWFAGQALANSNLCDGKAPEWQLRRWFGDRGGITNEEIAVKQALAYADAMLTARKGGWS